MRRVTIASTLTRASLSSLGALALVVACKGQQPAPNGPAGKIGPGEKIAVAEVEGARITAEVGTWSGSPDLLDHVTPVRLTIFNDTGRPVVVQYRYLKMKLDDGSRRPALPALKVDRDGVRHGRIAAPLFRADRFEVAPFYGNIYDPMPVYSGNWNEDPYYHATLYSSWIDVDLPTTEMIVRALPEGVLQPGGNVTGFVYFNDVDAREHERLQLHAHFVGAEDDQIIGSASLPFSAPAG